ncbi:hypothetical protein NEOLEDRAFT_154352 [Neolentinus lepideus HHB14362 ss-1]|uniref:Uncharacterized protein n=1 Tax=Neolentinus lepideus HHB14362 ss-1 TaxID=1314782 RepID=A0A165MLU0_9AGAM|nr:hypothetical protein NEOLEDRAFT_154352 [Neolentinus lepideus HHB14362 ss-1]
MSPRPAAPRIVTRNRQYSFSLNLNDGYSPVSIVYAPSSTSTVSDAIGPGRTMDKFLTFIGEQLTYFISRISARYLGLGPNALVGRMLSSIDWSQRKCRYEFCPNYSPEGGHKPNIGLSRLPPSIAEVAELLSLPFCHSCHELHALSLSKSAIFVAGCQKLVNKLRRSNSSANILIAYHVFILASFHAHTREMFVGLNAMEAFNTLIQELRLSSDCTMISPSRLVLLALSEDAIIPVIKRFNSLEAAFADSYHWHLPEREQTLLLPHSMDCVSTLIRSLLKPQLQIIAAARISRSVVLQELTLASILPGLRASLNADIIDYLWRLLASTINPVVYSTIYSLMVGLYDFATKVCLCQWDITRQCHIASCAWTWHTLWIPLFHLRLNFPSAILSIPFKDVQEICDNFFRFPILALLTSFQAREGIRALRRLMRDFQESTLPGSPRAVGRVDPIFSLMTEATSLLFEIAGILQEERLITLEHGGYDIPRYVPLSRVKELCKQIMLIIMHEHTSDSIVMSPPLLRAVAPYYDSTIKRELQTLAMPYRTSSNWSHSRRAAAIMHQLSDKGPEQILHCIGIAYGRPEFGRPGVFADHYKGPWAADRTYDPGHSLMFLITQDSYLNLRWVSIADMQEAEYEPIIVPSEGSEQSLRVVRSRNRLLDKGQLRVMTADDMQQSRDGELHVLCGQDPVFWMARTKLVHALNGQQLSNDLATCEIFWNSSKLPCPCELTWQKHCHGGV